MQGIWVFGDSYAAPHQGLDWPLKVSRALGLPLYNFAVSGSSTDYAIRKLFDEYKKIPVNDVVIFVASTVGRLHFDFQNQYPATSCWRDDADAYSNDEKVSKYFKDSRDHIRWYYTNLDFKLAHITHLGYKAVIKNFAESRPGTVIFLENTDILGPQEIINTPFNFINPKIFLCPISENEIIGRPSYDKWVKYTQYDARVNHLTEPNLETLARLITNVIADPSTANRDAFQYSAFQKDILDIITNRNELNAYIQKGYINPARHVPGLSG